MPLITISHEIGSGGREIGQKVAAKLGLPYIDREIVQEVAHRLGISETTAVELDERADNLVTQILTSLGYEATGALAELGSNEPLVDTSTYQKATQSVLDTMAASGNAVIAGHGANFYLAGRAHFLSVFIFAPNEKRIKTLMQRDQISQTEATKQVQRNDAERAHYIKTLYHADWHNPLNYQLLINTAFGEKDLPVELITRAAICC